MFCLEWCSLFVCMDVNACRACMCSSSVRYVIVVRYARSICSWLIVVYDPGLVCIAVFIVLFYRVYVFVILFVFF